MNLRIFLLALTTILIGVIYSEAQASRVAVLVNTGDVFGLQDDIADISKMANKVYSTAGFEIINLAPDLDSTRTPNGKNLLSQAAAIHGASDVRIDLIGHGGISQIPTKLQSRFPVFEFSSMQRQLGDLELPANLWREPKLAFVAVNTTNSDSGLFQDDEEILQAHVRAIEDSVGVGDLKLAIQTIQKNNPGVTITIHALNCFSGIIADQLSDVPGVQVFTNATATETAFEGSPLSGSDLEEFKKIQASIVKKGGKDAIAWAKLRRNETANGLMFYYRELKKSLEKKNRISFREAFVQSSQTYLDQFSVGSQTKTLHPPRSAVMQAISAFCRKQNFSELNSDVMLSSHQGQLKIGDEAIAFANREISLWLPNFKRTADEEKICKLTASSAKIKSDDHRELAYRYFLKTLDLLKTTITEIHSSEQKESIRKKLLARYSIELSNLQKDKIDSKRYPNLIDLVSSLKQHMDWPSVSKRMFLRLNQIHAKCNDSTRVSEMDCWEEIESGDFSILAELLDDSNNSNFPDECVRDENISNIGTDPHMSPITKAYFECGLSTKPHILSLYINLRDELGPRTPMCLTEDLDRQTLRYDLVCIDYFRRTATPDDRANLKRLYDMSNQVAL